MVPVDELTQLQRKARGIEQREEVSSLRHDDGFRVFESLTQRFAGAHPAGSLAVHEQRRVHDATDPVETQPVALELLPGGGRSQQLDPAFGRALGAVPEAEGDEEILTRRLSLSPVPALAGLAPAGVGDLLQQAEGDLGELVGDVDAEPLQGAPPAVPVVPVAVLVQRLQ